MITQNDAMVRFEMHCRKHCIVCRNMQCNYNAQQRLPLVQLVTTIQLYPLRLAFVALFRGNKQETCAALKSYSNIHNNSRYLKGTLLKCLILLHEPTLY